MSFQHLAAVCLHMCHRLPCSSLFMGDAGVKSAWEGQHSATLTASNFAKALGYVGKVYDYWYAEAVVLKQCPHLRFAGNANTAHGLKYEPVARAHYEALMGRRVQDGGFWVDIQCPWMGVSPDGIVDAPRGYCKADATPGPKPSPSPDSSPGISPERSVTSTPEPLGMSPATAVPSVQEPVAVAPVAGPSATLVEAPCTLLEIKCPVRSLYNPASPENQPFGIPRTHMCQVQVRHFWIAALLPRVTAGACGCGRGNAGKRRHSAAAALWGQCRGDGRGMRDCAGALKSPAGALKER